MPEAQKYKLTARQKRMLSDYQERQHVAAQPVQQPICAIDSIESLYKALSGGDEIKAKALLMLMLRSWLTEVSSFDPVSGHALYTGLVDFMGVVAKSMQDEALEGERKDRIYRIVSHAKEAVLAIMEHPRDKILREHAMLPIHAAREADSKSVQWLSRQPGRTLREKLSGKPYIKAVRRISSVDTAENRLLKAFLLRLEKILIERQRALAVTTEETCEELFVFLQRWLRSEDAFEIGSWGNLPPNNTILQDKRYRKVWDGWLWLQGIDEHIKGDCKRVHHDVLSVIYWNTISLLNHTGRFRTIQQPVDLDYDNFSIAPKLPIRGYLFPERDSRGRSLLDPLPMSMCLYPDRFHIHLGKKDFIVGFYDEQLFLLLKPEGTKKKLDLKTSIFKEIPTTILSLVTDSPFGYSEPENNQSDPRRMDSSVVDLCSIRPMFINNTGSQAYLPFRLLQQHWPLNVNDGFVIDCGYAKAIVLHPDIETISMKSLFSHSSTLSDAAKSSASMFFIKNLSGFIKADRLTYLVPDWGNDFDLEGIRKSVNFYFEESTPLPKSIAAIFAWQSSKKFVQDNVQENDFVLVVDSFDGGISITPVQAIYQKELNAILPEAQGMSWERHPTVIVPNRSIHTAMARNLERNGCQTSEELIQLFGFDGLASDAGEMSFVKDDHWYHLPGSIRDVLAQDLDLNILSNYAIGDCLNSTNRYFPGVNVFILPLEDTIKKPDLRKDYEWLGSACSPIKGCQTLNNWQKGVDDIALWRDHLPELSIRIVREGRFENFYLVKDATVTPQRGKAVPIPVKETFTLPAEQTHYSFPLQQGKGNKELQFVAYLKSPAFPLKEATACKLKMTYTYGADDPYELKFIPLDSEKAGFESIRVEWRSVSEGKTTDLENLPVPDFPARKTWSDFQKFPKEDGTSFSDLLGLIAREIEKIDEIENFINGITSSRIYDDEVFNHWNWKEDRNGKQFCCIKYNFGDVFFHENNFDKFVADAVRISFDLEEQRDRDGYVARNITLGKTISQKTVERFRKSLRFLASTIWNHGHSLSDSDVPDNFRNTIFEKTQKILSIIESEDIPDTLKEELFFFLCCLHKDAPIIVGTRLLDAAQDSQLLIKNNKNIALAIGDAELPWQQQLLRYIISPIDNGVLIRSITLEDLAIALWRSKELIFKLSETDLEKLCNDLFSCIQSDVRLLTSSIPERRLQFHIEKGFKESEAQRRERDYQASTLCKHLELLLALLRSRGNEDKGYKMILAPEKKLTQKYVALVDDVSRIVIDNDIELKSRICLKIDKPEIFRNTPDLLYALRMYLSGDSGANTIMISEVIDNE